MPTIFRYKGYRFFFFSNEGYEPEHVHVKKNAETAKFWLEPEVILAYSYEMSPSELKEIEGIIREKKETFKEDWNVYFGSSSGGQKGLV